MPEPRQLDEFLDHSATINPTTDWVVGYRAGQRGNRYRWYELIQWFAAQLAGTFASLAHNHPATAIFDSTEVGRGVLTAASKAAGRTALDAEELLSNRAQLLKIGEDIGGEPTWNGGAWPGSNITSTEFFLTNSVGTKTRRFFLTEAGELDSEEVV